VSEGPSPAPGAGPPVRIVLEFDPGEPPSGRVLREGVPTGEFSGRLELYAALERARDAPLPTPRKRAPDGAL
jgi:hypothetical protein